MKYFKVFFLLTCCILISCAKNNFTDVKEVLELEIDTISTINQEKYNFINTNTNQDVSIIHHLDHTGFHFYNSLKFKTENLGAIVGGTGLRVRITQNGGQTWRQVRFSNFANVFHSISFVDQAMFVVGENKFIFKSL